jgi:hypothetical protein
MAIDRRAFLLGSSGLLAGAGQAAVAGSPAALYAAARRGPDGAYSAAVFTEGGRDVRTVPLPDRGHDLTVCPRTSRCVVFARRPGNFAVAFSPQGNAEPVAFATPDDRHFYGHGVFSRDGRLLYATESDFDAGRGVIGVYDASAGFRRIGEFPSHGIGPHDLAFLRDEPVLVIANGGLLEHPDFGDGRRVLNPDAIETSIVYVDVRNGDLLERHDLAAGAKLSLRHMDVGRNDTVIIGAQLQGQGRDGADLVFRHRRQQDLAAVRLEEGVTRRLSGYISSVAVDASGEVAAVTSARGAIAAMIDVASGRLLRTLSFEDVSGIAPAPAPHRFLLTSGAGSMMNASSEHGASSEPAAATRWQWDNHAVLLPASAVSATR